MPYIEYCFKILSRVSSAGYERVFEETVTCSISIAALKTSPVSSGRV